MYKSGAISRADGVDQLGLSAEAEKENLEAYLIHEMAHV
jgi:hypothetical protein